jgi:hypothetical protein
MSKNKKYLKISTKKLIGERKLVNGEKILLLLCVEPKHKPKKKSKFKKNLHDFLMKC